MPQDDNSAYVASILLKKLTSLLSARPASVNEDIALPNESGQVDPRLMQQAQTPFRKIQAGYRTLTGGR